MVGEVADVPFRKNPYVLPTRRAGVEPCGKPTGKKMTDAELREMVLEDEEYERRLTEHEQEIYRKQG